MIYSARPWSQARGRARSALGGTPSSLWRSNSTPTSSENASWRPHAHFHRWKFGIALKRFPRTEFAPSAQGHAQVPYFYKVITHTVHHPLLARPSAETGFTHELRCTLYCFTHIADRCPPGYSIGHMGTVHLRRIRLQGSRCPMTPSVDDRGERTSLSSNTVEGRAFIGPRPSC